MSEQVKRPRAWAGNNAAVVALALGIAALFSAGVFYYEYNAVRRATEATFQHRTRLVRYYLKARLQDVDALARTFVQNFGSAPERHFDRLRSRPDFGGWAISGFASEDGVDALAGSASGLGDPPLSDGVRRELAAALSLDSQIRSILDFNEEIAWIYYTSARRFLYMAPKVPVATFRFFEGLYEKPFWWPATPAHNPQSRQIVSELYDDAAGKGLMISISSPLTIDREFVGVVSLDLGIQLLQRLLDIDAVPGETLLVGDDGRIVARAGDFSPNERYPLHEARHGWLRDVEGNLWLSSEVGMEPMRMLHRLRPGELYGLAALHSVPVWILLLMLTLLFLVLRRLNVALDMVTFLMREDPLTQTLNRRGLFDGAERLRMLSKRLGKTLAVAIFDIDFFKQINDSRGHEAGDQVLSAMGLGLKAQMREYDALCRWGGEEFVVLFMVETQESASAVAERMRTCVSDGAAEVTLSGGVVVWRDTESLSDAIDRADRLMYEAKQGGRNCLRADCSHAAAG